jgi:glucose/arabinose dehydrogenase
MRSLTLTLLAALTALVAAGAAQAAPRLTAVGSFSAPTYVTAPPGDPHRLFVVERAGVVKVIVDGGAPRTFLDIHGEVDQDGEEGLLSMAFAPDYATSGRMYVYFTAKDPAQGGGSTITVTEFRRSASDPNAADPATRRTLIQVPHPTNSNHDGGQLQFGPDGMLYIGTGDGGSGNDPPNNAQNRRSLLGKLLRIDPNPSPAGAQHSIPAGNPFASGASGAPEVWAYGLRNPWRFSFDRQTGDLVIGDVGQNAREEVDFAPRGSGAGANYGWRCFEGINHTPGISPQCTPSDYVPPVFDYDRTGGFGCSITGGYVVRDPALTTLAGRYLYADLCRSKLRSLVLAASGASGDREESLEVSGGQIVSFGEDSCGHVFVVSIQGSVSRIDDSGSAPCGEVGGGSGGAADTVAPALKVSFSRKQKLLRKKAVYVGAKCGEACGLVTAASARLKVGATTKKWHFAPAGQLAAAGQLSRLKLKLSKSMRSGLSGRVARGARPLVKVVITARDAAGNRTRKTVYVRVVG